MNIHCTRRRGKAVRTAGLPRASQMPSRLTAAAVFGAGSRTMAPWAVDSVCRARGESAPILSPPCLPDGLRAFTGSHASLGRRGLPFPKDKGSRSPSCRTGAVSDNGYRAVGRAAWTDEWAAGIYSVARDTLVPWVAQRATRAPRSLLVWAVRAKFILGENAPSRHSLCPDHDFSPLRKTPPVPQHL